MNNFAKLNFALNIFDIKPSWYFICCQIKWKTQLKLLKTIFYGLCACRLFTHYMSSNNWYFILNISNLNQIQFSSNVWLLLSLAIFNFLPYHHPTTHHPPPTTPRLMAGQHKETFRNMFYWRWGGRASSQARLSDKILNLFLWAAAPDIILMPYKGLISVGSQPSLGLNACWGTPRCECVGSLIW